MRILPLTLTLALALTAAGAADAAGAKSCAAQWAAMKKGKTQGSQTRAQFMATCKAAGAPGGAPQPVSPGGEPHPH